MPGRIRQPHLDVDAPQRRDAHRRERRAPRPGGEHDGSRGHPVILRAALLPSLVAAYPDANLRDVLRASGTRRHAVAVDDPGILFDLDTVGEYERALAWWREGKASS